MTTTRTRTVGITIKADRTPRISDLVPGATIYRFANLYARPQALTDPDASPFRIVSELPCHPGQMVSFPYWPQHDATSVPVVCRQCFASYDATPVPGTGDSTPHQISYRHTGSMVMSRPRRRRD